MTNEQYNELLARQLALKDDMIRLNKKATATMSMVFTCTNLLMTFAELAEVYAPLAYKRVLTAKDVQEWFGTEDFFETASSWHNLKAYTNEKTASELKKLLDHYGIKGRPDELVSLSHKELAGIGKKYGLEVTPVKGETPTGTNEEPSE